MTYTIREAVPGDAPEIARVHIASWYGVYTGIIAQSWLDSHDLEERAAHWRDALSQPIEKSRKTYLAYDDNQLAGFATVGQARDERFSDYAELWAIYADPAYYGAGVGRILLTPCFRYAVELGFDRMYVCVLSNNEQGRDFYERAGAQPLSGSEGKVTLGDRDYDEMRYEWTEI